MLRAVWLARVTESTEFRNDNRTLEQFYDVVCQTKTWNFHWELKANTTSTKARTSSENVTSRFCNHFSIIQTYFVWKMRSKYPGINLEPALGTGEDKLNICHHMLTSSTQLQKWSFHVVERTRTSTKCQQKKRRKMHVQSVQKYCFSLPNMQIYGVFVAVVVVVG